MLSVERTRDSFNPRDRRVDCPNVACSLLTIQHIERLSRQVDAFALGWIVKYEFLGKIAYRHPGENFLGEVDFSFQGFNKFVWTFKLPLLERFRSKNAKSKSLHRRN